MTLYLRNKFSQNLKKDSKEILKSRKQLKVWDYIVRQHLKGWPSIDIALQTLTLRWDFDDLEQFNMLE